MLLTAIALSSCGGSAQSASHDTDDTGAAGAAGATGEEGGASGAAGASGGESELTCAVPTQSGCPGELIPYSGQKADSVNHCRLPAVVLSCSAGASAEATCWLDADTGDIYLLDEMPCKPAAKWRDCTQAQSDEISALPLCE